MNEDLEKRNASAEKAIRDAIKALNYTLKLTKGRSEEERAAIFAEQMKTVDICILGDFVRRSPVDIMAEEHGIHLKRYADDSRVRLIGVREAFGARKIWEIDVDKVEHNAMIIEGGEVVMSIDGHKNRDVEQTAVRGMLQILRERRLCSSHERKARKAAAL